MLFGGRVAEEMIFGPSKITTGAGNDIERATAIARRMVTQFGMSEVLGPIAVGEQDHEIFLGREISQRRDVSDRTAEIVDGEIKRMLDEAYSKAEEVLSANRDLLGAIAEALLERETLDLEDVRILEDGGELPPLKDLAPEPSPALPSAPDVRRSSESSLEDTGGEPSPAMA
jgi:cell division protease FtsH